MANCFCQKCEKMMEEVNFYTYKDGTKFEQCKKCLTMFVDNFDEETYLWILEKADVPYVPEEWTKLRETAYATKSPRKVNGMSVLGKYLSKMRLKQFKDYTWADTEMLKKQYEERMALEQEEREEKMKITQERFENGEISEAEYKTLTSAKQQLERGAAVPYNPYESQPNNPYAEGQYYFDEDLPDPASELTKEDKLYLAMKWGRLYKPNEWIELEKKYEETMSSFDIQDSDTIDSLILLCKTYLKMNQCIDGGDVDGYQKLSRVYDSLRKSMKLTAAQNKEEKGNFVDSIGEFVIMCEREEGFIPRFPDDIPQDKVDLTLKDMNNYVYKLVTQDLGFGQQIEDALKKIQLQKEMNQEDSDVSIEALEEEITEEIIDEEYEEFYNSIAEQKEKDIKMQEGGEE